MRKRTEKKTDHDKFSQFLEERFRFFENPQWCPLYGELPWGDADETDPVYQGCQLIFEARGLWGVMPLDCAGIRGAPSTQGEIFSGYSNQKLQLARDIFACYPAIVPIREQSEPRWDGGQYTKSCTLSDHWEEAVDCVALPPGCENYPTDFEILVILSIAEAHEALERIVIFGYEKENREILGFIRDAQALLYRARSIEAESVTAERQQALEKKRKAFEQNKKRTRESKAARDERLRRYAEEIRRDFPGLAESHIPMTIIQLHPEFDRKKDRKRGLSERRIAEIIAIK